MNKRMRHIPGRGALSLAALPVIAVSTFLAGSAAPAQAATAAGHVQPLASYAVVNYEGNGHFCLGISGGRHDAPAVLWPCNTHPDQSWNLVGNTLRFQFKNGLGQCLGVSAGSTSQGAAVVAWNCQAGAANQYWSIDRSHACSIPYVPYAFYPLVNNETGYVVGVSAGVIQAGQPLVMWRNQQQCNNQVWGFA